MGTEIPETQDNAFLRLLGLKFDSSKDNYEFNAFRSIIFEIWALGTSLILFYYYN